MKMVSETVGQLVKRAWRSAVKQMDSDIGYVQEIQTLLPLSLVTSGFLNILDLHFSSRKVLTASMCFSYTSFSWKNSKLT